MAQKMADTYDFLPLHRLYPYIEGPGICRLDQGTAMDLSIPGPISEKLCTSHIDKGLQKPHWGQLASRSFSIFEMC